MYQKPFFLNHSLCLDPIGLHVLEDYQKWFANPYSNRKSVVKPRTWEEIKTWIVEISKNRKNCYFSIRANGENFGHLGVREIDLGESRAELDFFVVKDEIFGKFKPKEIFSWLHYFLNVHLGLKFLTVFRPDRKLGRVLKEAGFQLFKSDKRGFQIYQVA